MKIIVKNKDLKKTHDVPRVIKFKYTEPSVYLDEQFRQCYIKSYLSESDLYHDSVETICFFNSKAYKRDIIDFDARPENNLWFKYPKFKI